MAGIIVNKIYFSTHTSKYVMKRLIFILLYTFLISCNHRVDEEVTLELLNDKLYSYDYDAVKFNQEEIIYDSTYVKKSLNIVRYKITNQSKKSIAFFFRQYEYFNTDEIDSELTKKFEGFGLSIFHNNKVIDGSHITYQSFPTNNWDEIIKSKKSTFYGIIDFYEALNKFKLANQKDNHFSDLKRQYFVLFPGQSKHFVTAVNLPLRMPYDFGWLSKIEFDKAYTARVSLRVFKQNSKELPKFIQDEIEENKYHIFDGELYSNKVPLVVMPSEDIVSNK